MATFTMKIICNFMLQCGCCKNCRKNDKQWKYRSTKKLLRPSRGFFNSMHPQLHHWGFNPGRLVWEWSFNSRTSELALNSVQFRTQSICETVRPILTVFWWIPFSYLTRLIPTDYNLFNRRKFSLKASYQYILLYDGSNWLPMTVL